jgi:SAM-dependent methyltransferase
MSFYQDLAPYYDEIFALEPGEMDFFRGRLVGCGRLLEVGCGTGLRTVLLAAPEREIEALDMDADLLAQARARHAGPGIDYRAGDMRTIGLKFPAGRFDGLVCLGNTLPHLSGPFESESFLAGAARVLAPGGLLAVQMLNYDFLARMRVTELPVIETARAVFRRFYAWREDSVGFRAVLELKDGTRLENEIPLRPIGKDELEGFLANDFPQAEWFGGYDGRPFRPDNPVTVVLARRRG